MRNRRISVTVYADEEEAIVEIKKRGYASCDAGAVRFALLRVLMGLKFSEREIQP